MANTKREKLFAEFPPVPTEKWEEVIAVDLKGADYERKLVWRTPEGFNVRPYYRAENLEGLKFLASEPGEFPYVRGTRCDNVWRVHQSLTVKCPEAANAEALKLLDSGVDSPVSYTHLDVYKRQASAMWHGKKTYLQRRAHEQS